MKWNLQLQLFTLLFVLLSVFSACSEDEPLDEDTDVRLTEILRTASGGEGSSHFILPDSDDFSSIPQDPNNPLSAKKVALGKLLYHETGLAKNPNIESSMNTYSCSSCHHAQGGFQACLPQSISEGGIGFGSRGEGRTQNMEYDVEDLDIQPLRAPSALNTAFQPLMLWNGQFGATSLNIGTQAQWTEGTPKETNHLGYEGLETQAIAALSVHRMLVDDSFVGANPAYIQLFSEAFPGVADDERITGENAGLAIGAYERTLLANQSPFQKWLRGNRNAMSEAQKRGAIYFFSKAQCYNCHNGPALNDMNFYALGMKDLDEAGGVFNVDPNDAAHTGRASFTQRSEDLYKFKTPQLYNLKDSPFYGHGSSFNTVYDVIAYKNAAVSQNPDVPQSQLADEFQPLNLTEAEMQDIADFVENALHDPNLLRYIPDVLPSGNCFPNNDETARLDLGCD